MWHYQNLHSNIHTAISFINDGSIKKEQFESNKINGFLLSYSFQHEINYENNDIMHLRNSD